MAGGGRLNVYPPAPFVDAVAGGTIPFTSMRVTVATETKGNGPPHVLTTPVTWAAALAVSGSSTEALKKSTRRMASASIPRRDRRCIRGTPHSPGQSDPTGNRLSRPENAANYVTVYKSNGEPLEPRGPSKSR